jgi:hypothetical protein
VLEPGADFADSRLALTVIEALPRNGAAGFVLEDLADRYRVPNLRTVLPR